MILNTNEQLYKYILKNKESFHKLITNNFSLHNLPERFNGIPDYDSEETLYYVDDIEREQNYILLTFVCNDDVVDSLVISLEYEEQLIQRQLQYNWENMSIYIERISSEELEDEDDNYLE